MSDWEELDALTAELRAGNAAWAERIDALAGDAETIGKLTADVEQQYAALGVREALEALAQQALGGAATLYEARRPFGYSRAATLVWHPADDPRAEFASGDREGLLTIDVAVGPRLLLGGEGVPADDRLAVLILGEKRLMATLPTSREKFRAALLRAFAAPRRGVEPAATENQPPESSAPPQPTEAEPAAAPQQPAEGEPAAATEQQPTPEAEAKPAAEEAAQAAGFAESVAADRAGEEPPTDLRDGPPPGAEQQPSEAAAGSAEHSDEQSDNQTGDDAAGERRGPFKEPPDVIQL